MDRRKSIKSIFLGTVASSFVITSCTSDGKVVEEIDIPKKADEFFGRTPKELEQIAKLDARQFFNGHEMETLAILCALIMPANETYKSATDVGVPEFIEFMSKDIPEMQTPLRGGLMWLDYKSNGDFGAEFMSITEEQQKQILDIIAYPDMEIPKNEHPLEIQFFTLIRNLTLTGYYTSKEGIKDLGYKGNAPNIWDGVPEDVLAQHNMSYDPEWIAKCVDQSKRVDIAEWDEEGNLLT
ncbi:MAG: gluconate 2-dehydrogenase subunit 3 family protein [Cellulophaga sp.]